MSSYPFRAWCEAIRDHLRANRATFPESGGFPEDRPLDHNEYWYHQVIANQASEVLPGIFVSSANFEGERSRFFNIQGKPVITVTWLDLFSRVEKTAGLTADVMGWVCELFTNEGLELPGFVPPEEGSAVNQCLPAFARPYENLEKFKIVGAQIGIELQTQHDYIQ